MFRRLDDSRPERVEITLDGEALEVPAGISVAAALLCADRSPTRYSAISASVRAPYCMTGVCFECILDIDGVSGQRGCQIEVRSGMRIGRHRGVNPANGGLA